jgi:two-component system sensor histidine kinase/response regulator
MRLAGQHEADHHVLTARTPVPVLIVDDNAGKRLALRSVLSPLGYLIVEADSGTAALRCVMVRDFAVILLDVCMPDLDGFETAALIRQRRQSEMTPIIFITAYAVDELVTTDLYAEGAVDFIFAPVPPAELRAKVSAFANLFAKAEGLAARAREVQESADQLRMLTDAAPIGIFQTDAENRYVYTNPRWSELTGIRPEEATGQSWDSILAPDDRAAIIAEMAGGSLYRAEVCHRFKLVRATKHPRPGQPATGRTRVVLVTSKSVPDSEGGIAGWVGTLADVTAEAGAEAAMSDARDQANEGSRLKSDFLANMSHEIRTPMNGIIGMTELLLETELDTRQRDYAQTVRNSGEALLTILNDILDFSKIEAGRLVIEEIDYSLRSTIDDVVHLLSGPARAKGLELVASVENSVPPVIRGDPGRVRQVLTNLIGNALKFTQVGEVVVRVSASETSGDDVVLRFEVSDTGDGIAPEKLALIFQPFVQADTSTSRKYGGTGLGLAISGQLVSLMGGDCGVTSTLGAGSEFWFTVRVHADAGQAGHAQLSLDPDLAGRAVLIVNDSASQRHVLSAFLTDWGMNVTTAASGEEGLAAMQAAADKGQPFAVALLDRSMPGMDGIRLKDAIVADPALHAGLVLLNGLGRDDQLLPFERSGLASVLAKPVHREELRACVRVALELQPLTPENGSPRRPSVTGRTRSGRILLAEDNYVNQKVAVAMLASAGYEVDVVADGREAVGAAANRRYAVIVMDCQMPEMNGYDATALIRAQEGVDRHTPIIALTAGARREDRERCLAAGMDSYLAKPVSKEALLALVANYGGVAEAPAFAAPKRAAHAPPERG